MNPGIHDHPLFLQLGDAFVDTWQGAPFEWDGRTRHGVDCWGLAIQFYAAVHARQLPDWRRRAQGRAWIARTISGEAASHWFPLESPRDGCLVLSRSQPAIPHHFGIFWRGSVLHAAEGRGVILERLADFTALHPTHEFGEYVP